MSTGDEWNCEVEREQRTERGGEQVCGRAEAEDISGKLNEIVRLQGEIEELEDSMDTDDE